MTMEIEQDLRFTSDEMLRALERLRVLESRKRKLEPGTEDFRMLAEEVQSLAASVFDKTRDQLQLADESVELRDRELIAAPPIDEIPVYREVHLILADWRDAERRVAEASPGSAAASDAEADVQRFRQEYRGAAQAAWSQESVK